MKEPDVDRVYSERGLNIHRFLSGYNKSIPEAFPHASLSLLRTYQKLYAHQFKNDTWSFDQHRKRVMDWLPGYLRSQEP